jgi:hypothetical protein
MNRDFNPTSPLLRSFFLAAAACATVLTFTAIEGLATHYSADAQLAKSTTTVIARR